MKILYVTDLHGDKKKYSKILEVAIEKEIKVIVNGGDMLPKNVTATVSSRFLSMDSFMNILRN